MANEIVPFVLVIDIGFETTTGPAKLIFPVAFAEPAIVTVCAGAVKLMVWPGTVFALRNSELDGFEILGWHCNRLLKVILPPVEVTVKSPATVGPPPIKKLLLAVKLLLKLTELAGPPTVADWAKLIFAALPILKFEKAPAPTCPLKLMSFFAFNVREKEPGGELVTNPLKVMPPLREVIVASPSRVVLALNVRSPSNSTVPLIRNAPTLESLIETVSNRTEMLELGLMTLIEEVVLFPTWIF